MRAAYLTSAGAAYFVFPPHCKLRVGLVASDASNTMMNPNAARMAFKIPGAVLYSDEKVKRLMCPIRSCRCGSTLP